jgi:hypothetical protein
MSLAGIITNSPNRGSGSTKRKAPDTSIYKPPVMKTHLVSESQIQSPYLNNHYSHHHSRTNSQPYDEKLQNATNMMNRSTLGSNSNLYNSSQYNNSQPPTPYYQKPATHFPSHLVPTHHAKTFSLPVNFDPYMQHPNPQNPYEQPPTRTFNPNGDVPLPAGWSCERAPSGQFYYIK